MQIHYGRSYEAAMIQQSSPCPQKQIVVGKVPLHARFQGCSFSFFVDAHLQAAGFISVL